MSSKRFAIVHILDLIDSVGKEELEERLSVFSCPVNSEVEDFLKKKAIDFAERRSSITNLIIDESDAECMGYFTLAHRPISISDNGLSSKIRRRISNHSRLDEGTGEYLVSAFLLAQIGKNFAIDAGHRISGRELIDIAIKYLNQVRYQIGGGVVYLDCEDRPKLRRFYESPDVGFHLFGERVSEIDGIRYLQCMKTL